MALPSVGLLLFLQLLIFVAFNLFYVAFPVYAATALEWTLIEVGVYFAVTGLLMAVVQGPVLKRLTKVVSDRALVIGGSAILAAGFAFFASTSSVVIYAGTALVALGNGVMWPSLLSTLSKSTLSSVQGSVQGVSGSVTASASIAGLLIGGAFYQWMGSGVFLVSAGITALAAVAALRAGPRSVPTVELA